MKWWGKWAVSYTLSHLPGRDLLYQKMLRNFGELADIASSTRFENARTLLHMAHRWCGSLEGILAVEIGTGWIPAVPLGFALSGTRVETFDVKHLTAPDLFSETRRIIAEEHLYSISSASGTPEQTVLQRQKRIEHAATLGEALQMLGGGYHAPCDTTALPFADGEVDLVISNLVLQCIPKATLADVLAESRRILKPGGIAVHRIRMSDEYAGPGSGRNHLEYLKYPEHIWDRWFNHPLKHLNRLRAGQFLELFSRNGFLCRECRRHIDHDSIPLLQQLDLAPPFCDMSTVELATVGIDVVLEKDRA